MKKMSIGLVLFLLSIATNSFANISIPSFCGGFNFGLTYTYAKLSIPHLDYAVRYPLLTPFDPDRVFFGPFNVVFENGRVQSEDPNHDWYYRVNVGYTFPCTGNDAVVAYTSLDHDDTPFDRINRVDDVIIPTLISGTLNGIFVFPNIEFTFDTPFFPTDLFTIFFVFNNGSTVGGVPIDVASAKADFRYKAWDLEFGQFVNIGCHTNFRFYAGLRQANLVNRFDATYFGSVFERPVQDAIPGTVIALLSLNDTVITHQKSDFDGGGPRVGMHVNYNLCGGFAFTADASTSLLVGEMDATFQKANRIEAILTETVNPAPGVFVSQTNTQLIETLENFRYLHATRVVPNLEGKFGFGYTYNLCNCHRSSIMVEGGFMVSHYFNTVDRLSEIDKNLPEFRSRKTLDTSLEGPYVDVQIHI